MVSDCVASLHYSSLKLARAQRGDIVALFPGVPTELNLCRTHTDLKIGGLILTPGAIANDDFYEMVGILVVAEVPDVLVRTLSGPVFSSHQNEQWVSIAPDASNLREA